MLLSGFRDLLPIPRARLLTEGTSYMESTKTPVHFFARQTHTGAIARFYYKYDYCSCRRTFRYLCRSPSPSWGHLYALCTTLNAHDGLR
jgi:hypothetical protein